MVTSKEKYKLLFIYDDPSEPVQTFGDNHILDFLQYQLEPIYYLHTLGGHDVTIINNNTTASINGFQFYRFEDFPRGSYDLLAFWRKITSSGKNILKKTEYKLSTLYLCDFGYENNKDTYQTIQNFLETNPNHYLSPYTEKTIFRWNMSPRFWHRDYICSIFDITTDRLLPFPKDGIHPENLGYFQKTPKTVLFASSPSRGLKQLFQIFSILVKKDPKFELHVCVPERAKRFKFEHIPFHKKIWRFKKDKNDLASIYNFAPCQNLHYHSYMPPYTKEHWDLFKKCEYLVYPSVFTEPSSRVTTHARGAGCVILYPPNMGSPSDFLTHQVDAIIASPKKMVEEILYLEKHPEAKSKLITNSISAASHYTFEKQVENFTNYLKNVI